MNCFITVSLVILAECISILSDLTIHFTAVASFMDLGGEPDSIEVRLSLLANFLGAGLGVIDLRAKLTIFTYENIVLILGTKVKSFDLTLVIRTAALVVILIDHSSLPCIRVESTHSGLHCFTRASNINWGHLQTIFVNCSIAMEATLLGDSPLPDEISFRQSSSYLSAGVTKIHLLNGILSRGLD